MTSSAKDKINTAIWRIRNTVKWKVKGGWEVFDVRQG
jgi:hypothetical protein